MVWLFGTQGAVLMLNLFGATLLVSSVPHAKVIVQVRACRRQA